MNDFEMTGTVLHVGETQNSLRSFRKGYWNWRQDLIAPDKRVPVHQ